jgi:hypothetical protein
MRSHVAVRQKAGTRFAPGAPAGALKCDGSPDSTFPADPLACFGFAFLPSAMAIRPTPSKVLRA